MAIDSRRARLVRATVTLLLSLSLPLSSCQGSNGENIDSQTPEGPGSQEPADSPKEGGAASLEQKDGGVSPISAAGGGLSETDRERITVLVESCVKDDGFNRTLNYLRGRVGGYSYGEKVVDCWAKVTNGCAGVKTCLGFSERETDAACQACEGNSVVLCPPTLIPTPQVWVDCTATDRVCIDGLCEKSGAEACDEATFTDSCDERGRPLHCNGGLQIGPDCSSLGLRCEVDSSGRAACRAGGAKCYPSGNYFDVETEGTGCEGNTLKGCVGNREGSIDCRLVGEDFGCQHVVDGIRGDRYFCGLGSECNPDADWQGVCDGSKVRLCNAGAWREVDCTAIGFRSCVEPEFQTATCTHVP